MTLQWGLGSKKEGIEVLEEEEEEEEEESVVKGASESGSGDGNSSLVFTMSPETYEFLGQCVREGTHAEIGTQTNSFTSVGGSSSKTLKCKLRTLESNFKRLEIHKV